MHNSYRQFIKQQHKLLIFLFVCVVVGVAKNFVSQAATPNVVVEAESGVVSCNASVISDSTASAGKAVRFGAGAVPPLATGYTRVWEDQFDGTSLDPTRWNYFTGGGSTPDIYYGPESVSVEAGNLNIKTYTENGTHHTGWITTENKYQPLYGYMEARIDFSSAPAGAFWLFHNLVNKYGDPWNHGVEMDIVEHGQLDYLGNDVSNTASSNLNWGQYGAEWENHPALGSGLRGTGLASGFHTYSMEWTPTSQKYYIDGQYLWQVNDSTVSPISKRDEYMLLSYHPVGGAVDYGTQANSTVKMKVDYVKVCQLNPAPPPIPTDIIKSGGSGKATLNWALAANATSYKIKRASTSGGPYTAVGTTPALTYTDTTASTSSNYYYVVTALNSTGESANSTEVRINPNLASGKPTTASSNKQPATLAFDGDAVSFWESVWNTDPQWIYTDLQAVTTINSVILNWELAYAKAYSIEVSSNATTWTPVYSTTNGDGGIDEITFPAVSARYVRMYGTQRAHRYADPSPFGYAIKEFEVYSSARAPAPSGLMGFTNEKSVKLSWTPTPGATSYSVKRSLANGGPYTTVATNLSATTYTDTGLTNGTTYYHVVTALNALGESFNSNETRTTPHTNIAVWQQAYASSKENADTRPYKAFDGQINTLGAITTRWSSLFSDPQSIYVDLQTVYPINHVILNWDTHATDYDIQVSLDASTWTTVYSTTTGDGGIDDISFAPNNARYVRMYGRQRGTTSGYSLKEFEIYAQ